MKKYIIPLLTILTLIACEDEVPNISNNFVVEGYLTANQAINQITIKETYGLDLSEDPDIPITDADVIISKDNYDYHLTYNSSINSYEYLGTDLEVNSGDTFQIEISANRKIATAQTQVPETTQGLTVSSQTIVIPPITDTDGINQILADLFANARFTLNWENPSQDNYFIVVEKLSGSQPIFPNGFPITEQTLELIQSFSTVSRPLRTDSYEIPALSLDSYGTYKATVFRINQEYVDLFNSQTQDSRDLAEAPSNINNALGIFTAIAGSEVFFEVVSQ